jgi:hypothetical protein
MIDELVWIEWHLRDYSAPAASAMMGQTKVSRANPGKTTGSSLWLKVPFMARTSLVDSVYF